MSFCPTVRPSINIFTCKQNHVKTIPRTDSKLATKVDLSYQTTTINFHDDWPVSPSIHPSVHSAACPWYLMKFFSNPYQIWDTGCSRDPQLDYEILIPIRPPCGLASHRGWYSNGVGHHLILDMARLVSNAFVNFFQTLLLFLPSLLILLLSRSSCYPNIQMMRSSSLCWWLQCTPHWMTELHPHWQGGLRSSFSF